MEVISWNTQDFSKEISICVKMENENTKEIQILMPKNAIMKEHKAPFAISVQVLSGAIDFEVSGKSVELGLLDMISLEANVPHSLSAKSDSIVRLSLSKKDKIQRISAVLKK